MRDPVYITAYEDRDPSWIFVPDPLQRGRFCRVPRYVAHTTCPHCHSLPGQPCRSPTGHYWSSAGGGTHGDRTPSRLAAAKTRFNTPPQDIVPEEFERDWLHV